MSEEIYFATTQSKSVVNKVLSNCEEVIPSSKRNLLTEELKKLRNITESTINNSKTTIELYSKQCQKGLDIKNDSFWQNVPNPKDKIEKITVVPSKDITNDTQLIINDLVQTQTSNMEQLTKTSICRNKELTKKYFSIWKEVVKLRDNRIKPIVDKADQKEKLDNFIKNLKKWKTEEKAQETEKPDKKLVNKSAPSSSIYKNRFKAQKAVINMQKQKLEEQTKIIDELKLGIIREDLLKSIENTKMTIRDIFSGCNEKLKIKAPIVLIEENRFKINAQKAPKIIQKMESRALERAKYREIILERKRLIEETRQKLVEEAIEKKRILEEEERKKSLELMKEQRKKELEIERIRRVNKEAYLKKLHTAVAFYNNLLLFRCFNKLYNNLITSRDNNLIACEHYKKKIIKKYWVRWENYIESTYQIKYEVTDAQYTYKILKFTFKIWHEEHVENVRNLQVAEDLYDFRLLSNSFIHWHRYVCKQIMQEYKKIKLAEKHNNRRIIFHYFYQWRSLKAVLELEKAKELKKQRWREKVWEILPDYRPPANI